MTIFYIVLYIILLYCILLYFYCTIFYCTVCENCTVLDHSICILHILHRIVHVYFVSKRRPKTEPLREVDIPNSCKKPTNVHLPHTHIFFPVSASRLLSPLFLLFCPYITRRIQKHSTIASAFIFVLALLMTRRSVHAAFLFHFSS